MWREVATSDCTVALAQLFVLGSRDRGWQFASGPEAVVRLRFSQVVGYCESMPLTADVLASRILRAIDASGLTQQALADRINMESSALSKALSGKRNFKPLEVALISETLGVPVQVLLADPDQEPEPVSIAARAQPDSNPAVEKAISRAEQILELDQLLRRRGVRGTLNAAYPSTYSWSATRPGWRAGRTGTQQARHRRH